MITGFYAITPEHRLDTADLVTRTEEILGQGACCVLYRDTASPYDLRSTQAKALVELCSQYNRPALIYNDVNLASSVGASGVHFAKDSTHLKATRDAMGEQAAIGVSCGTSMRRALQAQIHGATYVTFGDLYVSAQTPLANLAPLSLIRSAKDLLDVNIVAIGGITSDNATPVLEAGADACAVTSLYDVPNSKLAAQAMAALFQLNDSNGEENVD